jgi:dTDP-4-dehydrorhamnose reductase
MRLLVTGAAGMLGRAVVATATELGHDVAGLAHADLDIADQPAADRALELHEPEAVVNCAAFTDVDAAEAQPELALAVNGTGAGNVARAAAEVGARVVHVSSDYVFDGARSPATGGSGEPWVESDPTGPLSQYGRSKLRGEEEVAAATPEHAIVRTSWMFGPGGRNFVDTMLRLARERDEVTVVTDQVGCPTFAGHLAGALVELAERREFGIHHVAGAGWCSWYELAIETFDQAGVACRVLPTTSDRFASAARRPAWSVLGSERPEPLTLPPWQEGVRAHLAARSLPGVRS